MKTGDILYWCVIDRTQRNPLLLFKPCQGARYRRALWLSRWLRAGAQIMSVGSMPSLHRSNIGNVRDGLRMLAEVIRGKCERARCKHEHVMVLIDDLGEVYASFATSGTTMLASLRNPSWLVGVYSCAF
jgi:hypothetical protein